MYTHHEVAAMRPSDEEIESLYEDDLKNGRIIRKMNKYEESAYSLAAMAMFSIMPYFTPILSLLSPVVDVRSETCYVTPKYRLGLSYNFFYKVSNEKRVVMLMHEIMHVLHRHFDRGASYPDASKTMLNYAADFEINTTLQKFLEEGRSDRMQHIISMYKGKLKGEGIPCVLPEDMDLPKRKSFEDYVKMLQELMQKHGKDTCPTCEQESESASGGSGESHPNGASASSSESDKSSDNATGGRTCPMHKHANSCTSSVAGEAQDSNADAQGIDSVGDIDIILAREKVYHEMKEALSKGDRSIGSGTRDFIASVIALMQPPKVDWRKIFAQCFGNAYSTMVRGRTHTTYRRVNRRFSQSDVVFPGWFDTIPRVMVGVDTSGSMHDEDYQKSLSEVEGIIRNGIRGESRKKALSVFSVDTEIKEIQEVSSVSEIEFKGGGGTDMDVAFKYVSELPAKKRPDVFVLCTDGYTYWSDARSYLEGMRDKVRSIVLVTQEDSYENAQDALSGLAEVILIDS